MPSAVLRFMLIVFTIYNFAAGVDIVCEVGWNPFQRSCYKYVDVSVYWQTARSSCQNEGADLAVVTNSEENNFIYTNIRSSAWIGLTDVDREGSFKWIDGTVSSYRNFASGQPDNNNYNQDCVELTRYLSGKWTDIECSFTRKYVCEKDADNEDPQFNGCPENVSVDTDQGTSYAEVSWTEPTASDDIGIETEAQSHSPGDRFELVDGIQTVYTVRYWVQDYAGNEAECLFNITVIDNEPPKLQCPKVTSNYYTTNYGSIIYASTDDGSPNGTITWTPLIAMDNSGIAPLITSYPNKPGDVYPMRLFPPYSTTIRATDVSGNSEECQIHFVVVDIESPVVNCPSHSNNFFARASNSSWSVFTDRASKSARLYWSPANATDNSGTVVSITSSHNPGDVFPASNVAHKITYTANDRDNNVGNCSFFITVEDWESPSVECPSPIQVYTDDGSRFAVVTWNITLNDNIAVVHCMSNDSRVVPANVTLNHKNITLAQNGSLSIGTNLVEYVVTDRSGNIGTCLLTITVVDNERPSIICPSNFSNYYDHIFDFHRLVADHGRPYATVTWSPPEVYDNSEESVTWESFPYTSGNMFPLREFPPYNVKFTASDQFGNNRSCYVYFTVIDIEPPIITCPTNITNYHDTYYGIIRAAIDSGSSTSTVTWDYPTVSDNSEGRVNVTSSHQSGEHFSTKFYPPYEVEYIAEDESGNRNSCKFYFLVTDNNPPEFQCPRSVRAYSQAGMNRSLVRWEIVLSDVELISLVQANHSAVMPSRLEPFKREVNLSASALLPTGITIIEYRFEDSSNNVAFCRFHVEISEYDSKVTSNSGTFNEHTITSAVTAASSTLSTVINRDDYSTDKYENMKTSALTSASLLPSRMSTSLASLTLLSSLISSSSLLPSQLPSSSSSLSSSSLSSSPSSSSPPFSPSSSTPSSSSLSSSPPPPLSQSSPSSLSSSAFTSLSSSSPSYSSLLTSSSPTPSSSASSSSSSESLSSSISSPATASSSSASSPAASPSSSTTSSSSASSSLPSKAFSFQSVTDTVFNTLYFTTQMETVDTIGQETLINDQENVDQLSTDQQLTDVYHSTDPQPTGFTDRRPHDQHTYHQQNGKNQTNAGSTDQRPAVEQPTTNERLTKQQDSTRQQPTHQPTINSHITLFEQLSTEVTVDSEQFPTTADSTGGDSRLQTENVDHTSLPTEPNEVSNSNNPYGTTEDDLYNPTSPYNLMTSRLAVGSKNANITGTAVITMVIISLCTIGGLSFLVIITIVIIKKKQVDKSSTTNRHSSNARRLDFENPAYKIYDLQNLDKECGVSRSGESLSNCEKVSRF